PQVVAVMSDCRPRGCRSLPADHLRFAFALVVENDWHVAARAVEMRFDDLQGKCCRDAGIEGISTFFENTHADSSGDPMGGSDHAEGPLDFRPRRERVRIDQGYAGWIRGRACSPAPVLAHVSSPQFKRPIGKLARETCLAPGMVLSSFGLANYVVRRMQSWKENLAAISVSAKFQGRARAVGRA